MYNIHNRTTECIIMPNDLLMNKIAKELSDLNKWSANQKKSLDPLNDIYTSQKLVIPTRPIEEFIRNEHTFIKCMIELRDDIEQFKKDNNLKLNRKQRRIITNYLSNLDVLLESYKDVNISKLIDGQDFISTIKNLKELQKSKEFSLYIQSISALILFINDLRFIENKFPRYALASEIKKNTIKPAQRSPQTTLTFKELVSFAAQHKNYDNSKFKFNTDEFYFHALEIHEKSKENALLNNYKMSEANSILMAKQKIKKHSSTSPKITILNHILSMNIANPIHEKSDDGTPSDSVRAFKSILPGILAECFPNLFSVKEKSFQVNGQIPEANLINQAMGIDTSDSRELDNSKFDHKKLQQLYNKYKNTKYKNRATLFAVLESTKPIDSTFSPIDKVNAYIRVATQYSNGAIFKDGSKNKGVLAMAKAAYASAGQYPETKNLVDKAFASTLKPSAKNPSKTKLKEEREQDQFGNWLAVRIPNYKLEIESAYLKGQLEQESTQFYRRQKSKPSHTVPDVKKIDVSKQGLYRLFKSLFEQKNEKEDALLSIIKLHVSTPIQMKIDIIDTLQNILVSKYSNIFQIVDGHFCVNKSYHKHAELTEALGLSEDSKQIDFGRFKIDELNKLTNSRINLEKELPTDLSSYINSYIFIDSKQLLYIDASGKAIDTEIKKIENFNLAIDDLRHEGDNNRIYLSELELERLIRVNDGTPPKESDENTKDTVLFKLLKCMMPVNEKFSSTKKIEAYRDVMKDIYEHRLSAHNRNEYALQIAKSAYSIAGSDPDTVKPNVINWFGPKINNVDKDDDKIQLLTKEEITKACTEDFTYGVWLLKKTKDTHNTRLELEHAFAQGKMQKKTLEAQTIINDMQSKKSLYTYTSMASTARMVNIAKEQMRVAGPLPENKKSNALRHILNLHINTPLQKLDTDGKPVVTPTLFSDYLKTLLVTAYPELFVLEKGQFKINPKHKDQALLQTALGLDGKSGLLDCNKFDPEALQQLYMKYKNNRDMNFPLFAVLESTKPVNPLFSAEEKMSAYERIAQAFYDKKIGKAKEAVGAMVVLKSAESLAKECEANKNYKPMQMFKHAFSSTKEKAPKIALECSNGRFGNWIAGGSSGSKNEDSDGHTPRRLRR